MDPISLVMLGLGVLTSGIGLFKQNGANDQAEQEGQRQVAQAAADATLLRLKNDAIYLVTLRDAETKRQADALKAVDQQRRQSLSLGLVAVVCFSLSIYLLFRPAPRA